ncbi:galactokinase [Aliifodinibius sp. S!AR15-10]|uniref:galactokinase n=1 Tax=Aliifodinibius sp. S!AR15-10 TaxID=2950437 RepID=UPI00285739F8|nr:galactokinase [Aliifodinibius sp. S!AR15-10]MDR8392396.1 galactokinase [Aliifodinibius sp. S!AR15-10]
MKQLVEKIESEFSSRFHDDFILVKSPGRVNLIGEHTDYNDGFVLPAAIDKVIVVAIAPNDNREINMVAVDKGETHHYHLDDPLSKTGKGWPDYILGVIAELQLNGFEFGGFDCVFGGNIPIGAGLSSSAAFEGGIITGVAEIYDLDIPKRDRALLGQKVENEFVGVQCGIMDQFVNIHGEDDHALKLDCRSLEYELYPFKQDDIHIVLCDTKIRRELATSEYNIRRKQCEKGVEILAQYDDSVESLRDVSLELLEAHEGEMEPVIYKRCRYVIEENNRVEQACSDLEKGDIERFGQRMYGSHHGLSNMYEVSCEELDILVEEAREIEGVLGSRMMGGGFGGCTINLVEKAEIESFSRTMKQRYNERLGREIEIYRTRIGAGAGIVEATQEKN